MVIAFLIKTQKLSKFFQVLPLLIRNWLANSRHHAYIVHVFNKNFKLSPASQNTNILHIQEASSFIFEPAAAL